MRNRIALSLILVGTLLFGVHKISAFDGPPTPQQQSIFTAAMAMGFTQTEAETIFDQASDQGISEEDMLKYLGQAKTLGITKGDVENYLKQQKGTGAASGGSGGSGGNDPAQAASQAGLVSVAIQNPLGGTKESPQGITDIRSIIAMGIKAMLGLIGSLALLMFVYGGFLWLTSRGNTEMVAKGSKAMTWSALGIALIFSSYALVEFVFKAIGAAGT